jgi:hypothetical protein
MASFDYTFTSGDTVTPTKLNAARNVKDIVNADISATAAIAGTKITPAFGAQDIAVSGAARSITNTGNFALSFGTNNTERVRIDDAGNVGIGTNTPFTILTTNKPIAGGPPATSGATDANVIARFVGGGVAFDIGGTAAGAQWIQPRGPNDFSSNLGLLLCPNGGNVGVGVTSASARLHVASAAAATTALLVSDGTNYTIRSGYAASGLGYIGGDVGSGFALYSNNTERMRIDASGNVGIGGTANAAAILDAASTTQGFLPPRMTTAQRDAISAPPAGLVIYNTSTNVLNFYNGSAWGAV